jgi:hypothetical protein
MNHTTSTYSGIKSYKHSLKHYYSWFITYNSFPVSQVKHWVDSGPEHVKHSPLQGIHLNTISSKYSLSLHN